MLIHSPKELAVFITKQRKKLKLSQAKVANLVGLKQKTISRLENKPETTKLDTLFYILSALNLNVRISDNENANVSKTSQWMEEW